jgi:peptide-methionine (S)-S-oxide reductase
MPERAIFAAGCFWHVQETFSSLKGVLSTAAGYSGGSVKDPTYEMVCTGRTGHAESVLVEYDPSVISYDQLLDAFWSMHDPTTPNRQGPDRGTQYRSVIFYTTDEQREKALASRDKLQGAGQLKGRRIVTEIAPASGFYRAEEYHQHYLRKNRTASCRI